MAALPIAACGGPLLYGLVKSPTHHYAFVAVTLSGYSYRLEQQGTKLKPKIGFRCRSSKCQVWVKVDGTCEHKRACLGGTELAKGVVRKMAVDWALFMAWHTNRSLCGLVQFIQFARLCGVEVDQEEFDGLVALVEWARKAGEEVVEALVGAVKSGAALIRAFNQRCPNGPRLEPVGEPPREEPIPQGPVARGFSKRLAAIRKRSANVLARMDKTIKAKRSRIKLLQSEIDRDQADRDEQQRRFDAMANTLMAEMEELDAPNDTQESSSESSSSPGRSSPSAASSNSGESEPSISGSDSDEPEKATPSESSPSPGRSSPSAASSNSGESEPSTSGSDSDEPEKATVMKSPEFSN